MQKLCWDSSNYNQNLPELGDLVFDHCHNLGQINATGMLYLKNYLDVELDMGFYWPTLYLIHILQSVVTGYSSQEIILEIIVVFTFSFLAFKM